MVKVTNPHNVSVTLNSFDGDSVQIQPGAKQVPVDDKFLWQIGKSGLLYDKAKVKEAEKSIKPPVNLPTKDAKETAPAEVADKGKAK